MGACLSLTPPPPQKAVRVVHFNGGVEDFDPPVTAAQVAGGSRFKNYFLCTATQLLCPSSKPLRPDDLLDPGRIYFIVPYTALQSDVDSAFLVKKLTAKAKSRRKVGGSPGSSFSSGSFGSGRVCESPVRSFALTTEGSMSPCRRSPNRRTDPVAGVAYGSRSWRPNLDPIREKSFNRRSESDLQEM